MTTLELLLFLKNLQPGFRYYSSSLFLITHTYTYTAVLVSLHNFAVLVLQKNTRHYYPAVKFQKVATWYLKIRPNQTKMISRESNIIYAIPSFPVSSEPCTSLGHMLLLAVGRTRLPTWHTLVPSYFVLQTTWMHILTKIAIFSTESDEMTRRK